MFIESLLSVHRVVALSRYRFDRDLLDLTLYQQRIEALDGRVFRPEVKIVNGVGSVHFQGSPDFWGDNEASTFRALRDQAVSLSAAYNVSKIDCVFTP